MGCDGLWDCVDYQKFCEQISLQLSQMKTPCEVITSLIDQIVGQSKECKMQKLKFIAPIGTDNITCNLIIFKEYNI